MGPWGRESEKERASTFSESRGRERRVWGKKVWILRCVVGFSEKAKPDPTSNLSPPTTLSLFCFELLLVRFFPLALRYFYSLDLTVCEWISTKAKFFCFWVCFFCFFIATMGAVHFSLMKLSRGFLVCLLMWGMLSLSYAARYGASRQKFEVKKHLNRLNKPAVKSIQVQNLCLFFTTLCASLLSLMAKWWNLMIPAFLSCFMMIWLTFFYDNWLNNERFSHAVATSVF